MKTLALTLVLLASVPQIAQACLGETLEECTKRYGTPTAVDDANGTASFIRNNLNITCYFYKGQCCLLEYSKRHRAQNDTTILDSATRSRLAKENGLNPKDTDFDLLKGPGSYIEPQRHIFAIVDRTTDNMRKNDEMLKKLGVAPAKPKTP